MRINSNIHVILFILTFKIFILNGKELKKKGKILRKYISEICLKKNISITHLIDLKMFKYLSKVCEYDILLSLQIYVY